MSCVAVAVAVVVVVIVFIAFRANISIELQRKLKAANHSKHRNWIQVKNPIKLINSRFYYFVSGFLVKIYVGFER